MINLSSASTALLSEPGNAPDLTDMFVSRAVKPAVKMHFLHCDHSVWTVRSYEDEGDASSETLADKLRLHTVLILTNAALINL